MRCTGKREGRPTTGIDTTGWGVKTYSEAMEKRPFLRKRQCARGQGAVPGGMAPRAPQGYACRMMKLHNYFRSSASFRVRIALNLKGLDYQYIPVHIARGEHKTGPFAAISPDMLVPLLEDDGERFTQSMAIIEYLDEIQPEPPLLPHDAVGRAGVRALSESIACEIHPLNNLRVLKYLVRELKLDDDAKNAWYRHWVREGMLAF